MKKPLTEKEYSKLSSAEKEMHEIQVRKDLIAIGLIRPAKGDKEPL